MSTGDVDPTPLAGTWTNTNAQTTGCTQIRLAISAGTLQLEARRGERVARGAATAYAGRAGTTGVALTADVRAGDVRWVFEGNVNQGLLVLGCYQTGPDRPAVFSREYFTPRPTTAAHPPHGEGTLHRVPDISAAPTLEAYPGTWRNADPRAGLMPSLDLVPVGTTQMSLHLAAPRREVPCEVHADIAYGVPSGAALRARDDAACCDLQMREVKGVLVVAGFQRPPAKPPRFVRAFYYRA